MFLIFGSLVFGFYVSSLIMDIPTRCPVCREPVVLEEKGRYLCSQCKSVYPEGTFETKRPFVFNPAPFLVGCIFFGVGLYLVYESIAELGYAKDSLTWPSTLGQIVSCSFHPRSDGVSAEFEYSVRGRCYTSWYIYFGRSFREVRAWSLHYFRKYKDRPKVTVYYNPQSPDIAVLVPGTRHVSYSWFILPGIFTTLGSLLLVSAFFRWDVK